MFENNLFKNLEPMLAALSFVIAITRLAEAIVEASEVISGECQHVFWCTVPTNNTHNIFL